MQTVDTRRLQMDESFADVSGKCVTHVLLGRHIRFGASDILQIELLELLVIVLSIRPVRSDLLMHLRHRPGSLIGVVNDFNIHYDAVLRYHKHRVGVFIHTSETAVTHTSQYVLRTIRSGAGEQAVVIDWRTKIWNALIVFCVSIKVKHNVFCTSLDDISSERIVLKLVDYVPGNTNGIITHRWVRHSAYIESATVTVATVRTTIRAVKKDLTSLERC